MDNSDRRKEILNVCLDTFINKGLSETTVRDLSTALKLQSGGIYYWFKDKDEAVVACAEEAEKLMRLRYRKHCIPITKHLLRYPNRIIFAAMPLIRSKTT